MKRKRCSECSVKFVPYRRTQVTCSPKCRVARIARRGHDHYRQENPEQRRECVVCRDEFVIKCGRQLTCGKDCQRKYRRDYSKQWDQDLRDARPKGGKLATERWRCAECGDEFVPRSWVAKLCGKRECKRANYRRFCKTPIQAEKRRTYLRARYRTPHGRAKVLAAQKKYHDKRSAAAGLLKLAALAATLAAQVTTPTD